MGKIDSLLVYHWQAWRNFLIKDLVADYCHLEARYDDDASVLKNALTPNIKAVLFQINLSCSYKFPENRRQLIAALQEHGIFVMNTEVEDISKRSLHYLLASAGLSSAKASRAGSPDDVLFVKSDLNSGGEPEQLLSDALRARLLSPEPARIGRWNGYFVMRRGDIGAELWSDESIVIENYIENPENSFYRVYGFGSSIALVKSYSDSLIKKVSGHCNDRYVLCDKSDLLDQAVNVPVNLQKTITGFITHYPLAYFCLDIVHDMQQYTIIDLNLTPYSGDEPEPLDALEFLRKGGSELIKRKLQ